MAKISGIPKSYQSGIRKILSMPEQNMQQLCVALEKAHPTLTITMLASQASEGVKGVSVGDIEDILSSIRSLVILQETTQISLDQTVQEISKVIESGSIEKLKFADGDQEEFSKRVKRLLRIESVITTSLSADLLTEFENLYLSARVLTDIRPVFGSAIEPTPKAAIVIHSLHFHYHFGDAGEHKDFYLALDNEEIGFLITELQRAQKRAAGIKTLLNEAKVIILSNEKDS